MASTDDAAAPGGTSGSRQRVVRVPGARRAKLTPAPGASPEPAPRDETSEPAHAPDATTVGPNDERLRRDVPPHY